MTAADPATAGCIPTCSPTSPSASFTADEIARKARALRAHESQVSGDSVVEVWLDAPVDERFAPLPPRHASIPRLRSYYDEVFRFGEQGIDHGTVDRVLRAALAAGP